LALERIPTVIIDDPDALARHVAGRIADLIRARAREGRRTVLGLATGSTPVGVYRELVRAHRRGGTLVPRRRDVQPRRVPSDGSPESFHSYHRFMWEHLFSHVDIDPARVHIPRGDVPRDAVPAMAEEYEARIREAGGIDFQLLGIGKTGHIGFNEPGSDLKSRTRLVALDSITRKDAAADFFGEDNVPREAVTMGIATILAAREIAIIATGEHKAAIVRRAVEGEVDLTVAATALQQHPATTFFLDDAAASDLTRIATPWLVSEVEWTDALTVRAVVWLARRTGKALLKLTARDYADHHLGALLARHGTAGTINGFVFNSLGARIRGRSKLPRDSRVVVFSPHPDDDVISMGGILHKLAQNGNRIVVAYQTSGNTPSAAPRPAGAARSSPSAGASCTRRPRRSRAARSAA
jgi:glucosamine-6-phosphate deaminase